MTIFAPSDEAFSKLPEGTIESLTITQKLDIFKRHIVPDTTVYAADVKTGKVKTLGGEKIFLIKAAKEGVQIYHNGNLVNVVKADVEASNGVIHVIDKVIL